MPVRRIPSVLAVAVGATASLLALAAPVSAHVTVSPGEVPADDYGVVELMVPHGCGEAPTEELSVQLDPAIQSVTAEAVPGWTVDYTTADLDEPYELHGSEVTTYVAEITWTADEGALSGDQYVTFGISARWPADPGATIALPAVQRCDDGSETAWIETDADAEHPAPVVEIVPISADGDQAHGDEVAAPEADDDGSSSTVGIVALVLAGLALAGSAYAVVSTRRA